MLDTADPTDLVHDITLIILDLPPCPISAGSQRPHYENSKLGKHQTNVTNAQQQYLLWLLLMWLLSSTSKACV